MAKYILLFSIISLINCRSQSIVEGTYYSKNSGVKIELKNGTYNIRNISNNHLATNYCDTISYGTFKKVNSEFIELNSYNIDQKIYSNQFIDKIYTNNCNDSISIKVNTGFFNDIKNGLEFELEVIDMNNNSDFYKAVDNIIKIPKDKNHIKFQKDSKHNKFGLIVIIDNLSFYDYNRLGVDGTFLGRSCINIPILEKFDNNISDIIINLPKLNECSFTFYFLENEYIRFNKNKLFWMGKEFKRE